MVTSSSAQPAASAASAARVTRRRATSWRVRFVDRMTTWLITSGGVLVMVAVLAIMVFLVVVVVPLFRGASVSEPRQAQVLTPEEAKELLVAEVDEYRRGGLARERVTLFGDTPRATAFARNVTESRIAIGFADGTVRLGRLAVSADGVDAELDPPISLGSSPVALLDYGEVGDQQIFTTIDESGRL